MFETLWSLKRVSALSFSQFSILSLTLLIDQYILYDRRWVGEIAEVAADVTIRLSNNSLVQISHTKLHEVELAGEDGRPAPYGGLELSESFVIGQRVVVRKSILRSSRWILGEFDPKIAPHGIVVDVRTKSLTVNWLAQRYQAATNQPINTFIQPNPSVYPSEDHVVVLSDGTDLTSHQIGDRVRFLDRSVETEKYGAQRMDRRDLGGFDGNVWMVVGTNTFVDVDWQDGTTSANVQARDLRTWMSTRVGQVNLFRMREQVKVPELGLSNLSFRRNELLEYASLMRENCCQK